MSFPFHVCIWIANLGFHQGYPSWKVLTVHNVGMKKHRPTCYSQFMSAAEHLSEHTLHLPALGAEGCVCIQNQTRSGPTMWDKTGIVADVPHHDHGASRWLWVCYPKEQQVSASSAMCT